MLDTPLFLLGFLSIFHIIGGIALGTALRNIWKMLRRQGGSASGLFFLVWGGMFACIPLAFGTADDVPVWIFPTQLAIVIVTVTVTAFWEGAIQEWAKPLLNVSVGMMVFGGIFMGAGLLFGSIFAKEAEDLFFGLMFVGIFGLVGLGIFLFGLFSLFKDFRS